MGALPLLRFDLLRPRVPWSACSSKGSSATRSFASLYVRFSDYGCTCVVVHARVFWVAPFLPGFFSPFVQLFRPFSRHSISHGFGIDGIAQGDGFSRGFGRSTSPLRGQHEAGVLRTDSSVFRRFSGPFFRASLPARSRTALYAYWAYLSRSSWAMASPSERSTTAATCDSAPSIGSVEGGPPSPLLSE